MAEQIKIILPEAVKKIINVLQSAGYEAWAVGGCVRDSILHREPDDWDITTSARPEQVKVLFHRTVDTGIPVSYTHLDVYKRQCYIVNLPRRRW